MTGHYQLFDALPAAVESALRESIQRFGVLVPVAVDQHGNVLDGHHRQRIAAELGVEVRVDVHQVADETEAREIARTLNSDRRHLTDEQRRDVVAALRSQGHSLRAIAGAVGVDKRTVQRDITRSTGAGAPVEVPDRVVGLDGKQRPATRPPATEQREVIEQLAAPAREAASKILEADVCQPAAAAEPESAEERDDWPPPGWVPPAERVKAMPSVMGARAIEQLYGFLAIVKKAGGPAAIVADEVPGLAAMSNPLNWHALRDARDVIDEWMRLLEDTTRLRRVK